MSKKWRSNWMMNFHVSLFYPFIYMKKSFKMWSKMYSLKTNSLTDNHKSRIKSELETL